MTKGTIPRPSNAPTVISNSNTATSVFRIDAHTTRRTRAVTLRSADVSIKKRNTIVPLGKARLITNSFVPNELE